MKISIPTISMRTLGIVAVVALGFALPLLLQGSPYFQSILIRIAIYAFIGMALNIPCGYTNMIAVNQITLFGIGAYTSTFLQIFYGVNPWVGMLVGVFIAVAIGVGFIYPILKLPPLFLCISTIAFSSMVYILFMNWTMTIDNYFCGGAVGVFVPLQPESLMNFQWHTTKLPYCYIILLFLFLEILLTQKLIKSKIGYSFIAIREDEDAAKSLGVNTTKYKLLSMAISAAISAIGGTFFAQYLLFVEPNTTMSSVFLLEVFMVNIIGGQGTILGPLVGAIIYIPVSETLRIYVMRGVPRYAGVPLIVLGVVLIIVMHLAPTGLLQSKWIMRLRQQLST